MISLSVYMIPLCVLYTKHIIKQSLLYTKHVIPLPLGVLYIKHYPAECPIHQTHDHAECTVYCAHDLADFTVLYTKHMILLNVQ
jgi:hypothetical protein